MNKQRTKIDVLLVDMPFYVRDYTRSKLVIPYSYVTLINYLRIFKRFFIWLMDNNYTKAIKTTDIELHELENLAKRAIEKYRIDLREGNVPLPLTNERNAWWIIIIIAIVVWFLYAAILRFITRNR